MLLKLIELMITFSFVGDLLIVEMGFLKKMSEGSIDVDFV